MSYAENRVYVKNYARIPEGSPLLVPVPTSPRRVGPSGELQVAHVLTARHHAQMSAAAERDLGYPLLVASGWREHRWKTMEAYMAVLAEKYGARAAAHYGHSPSPKELYDYGRLYLAFDSAHETGLALDFECGGPDGRDLTPDSTTIARQEATLAWKWLVDHAWEHGFTPYKVEPWHWELNVSRSAFESGVEDEAHPSVCEDESHYQADSGKG